MLHEIDIYQNLAEPYLHEICAACHATSVWLVKHDFSKRVATVVAEYIGSEANAGEKRGDIGGQFPEGIASAIWTWLRTPQPHYIQFHVDDIPHDSLEYFMYLEDDVKSVVCFAVYSGAEVWGFISVWDTQQQDDFTQAEIEAALTVIRRFEQLI